MLKVSHTWPWGIHSSQLLTCLHHSFALPYLLVQDIPCLPCIFSPRLCHFQKIPGSVSQRMVIRNHSFDVLLFLGPLSRQN